MKFLAIDAGSSYAKAALLDLDIGAIAEQTRLPQAPRLDGGERRYEVDAERLFAVVEQLVRNYLSRHGAEIKGILLSTQMHGFVLADERFQPVTPYISWQDERCLEPMPGTDKSVLEHMASFISRDDMAETGVYLKPPLAMCNLYALLQSGFAIRPGMRFCTVGSYLIGRLTGRHVCHITNAGPTGFADVRAGCWAERLIRLTGAVPLAFPELVSGFPACGVYQSGELEIPVYPDIGDQQAGALGSLAVPVEDAIVNIGTAAQLGLIRPDFVPGPYEIRPFFDGQYLYTITRLPGGRNLDVLIRFFGETAQAVTGRPVSTDDVWAAVQSGLTALESRGLAADCSFYQSEYSAHGRIDGIQAGNLSPYTLLSAAFEDIARTYKAALMRLSGTMAAPVSRLVFSGGVATRLPLLRRAILQELGISRSIDPIDNEVFIGLYRLALHVQAGSGDILSTREAVYSETGPQPGLRIECCREAL